MVRHKKLQIVRAISLGVIFLILAILSNIHYQRPIILRGLFSAAFQKTITAYLHYQTKSFSVLEGERIILKYTPDDQALAPLMLQKAEEYYLQVQEALNIAAGSNDKNSKVLVVVYPDSDALNSSLGLRGDRSADGAYWAGSIRIISPHALLAKTPTYRDAKTAFLAEASLVHELTHYLVDKKTAGNYTRWLSEGLAQYLEREISGYLLPPPAFGDIERLYSFAELERDFDKQPDQALAYWQSLCAVSYLMDEYGPESLGELLNTLEQGHDFNKALRRVYRLQAGSLEEIVRKNYLEGKV